MSRQKITNESADHKYFIITPQLVWAYSRDLYDYTLWNIVKMIAGDEGECFLATEDLAALAMMSVGKVSNCRQYLIEAGLLEGELRKDPSYPQPVWHLRVPDLWRRNIEWRESHDSIKSRLEWKREQKKSLHQVKPSPGEEGPPPGEEGPPPGEAKNNHTDNQQKTTSPDGEKKRSLTDSRADSHNPTSLPTLTAEQELDMWLGRYDNIGSDEEFAARQELQRSGWHRLLTDDFLTAACIAFLSATGWDVPLSHKERKYWASEFNEWREFERDTLSRLCKQAYQQLRENRMNVDSPRSLTKVMRSIWRNRDRGEDQSDKEELVVVWKDTGERVV